MNIVEFILITAWLFWFALYFRLAWRKGNSLGPSYSKMLFPILLFIESSWPPETEIERMKLQISLLALTAATAAVELIT